MSKLYISIRRLCDCCYPVRVTRYGAVTLQECDPTATRQQIIESALLQLTADEHDQARRAYGQPPIGCALDDDLMGGLCLPYVPPALRLRGEPAVQRERPDEPGPALDAFEEALLWWATEGTPIQRQRSA